MQYVHIKNIEEYNPGYKDRQHIWAKIYWCIFIDEKYQELSEIDRHRLISLIVFETYTQHPVALTPVNLALLGWNINKRPISLTLQMLHTMIEVRNENVTQSRVEESRVEESRVEKATHLDFVKLTKQEHEKLIERFGKENTKKLIEKLNCYIGSKGNKYKSHYYTILNWATKDGIVKPYQEKHWTEELAEAKKKELLIDKSKELKQLTSGIGIIADGI